MRSGPHIEIIADRDIQHIHPLHHNSADPLWSKPYQSISSFHNHWWLQQSFTSLRSCPTTRCSRRQDHRLDHQQGPARFKRWLCYSHQLNYREWQHTRLVTLWSQLVNQNIMVTSRSYWQFRPSIIVINHRIRYQSVIPRKARWRRNGVDWSSFTNKAESRM